MTVVRFNPRRDALMLREAMEQLLEDTGAAPLPGRRYGTPDVPLRLPVDVYRTPAEIVIVASLPGLLSEEVEVTIEGDTLTIRGELRPPLDNVEYLFQERPHGNFGRSLVLNIPVDVDQAEAIFENGVLTLTLPKAEAAKPRSINVRQVSK